MLVRLQQLSPGRWCMDACQAYQMTTTTTIELAHLWSHLFLTRRQVTLGGGDLRAGKWISKKTKTFESEIIEKCSRVIFEKYRFMLALFQLGRA